MSNDPKLPDFDGFTRWLTGRFEAPRASRERYEALHLAARSARDEFLRAQLAAPRPAPQYGPMEVLQLLAAADKLDSSHPPEVMTTRGFRVTLSYDETEGPGTASICVLVRCPPELIESVQGKSAYLWNANARFELGEFDSEGKALGTLPAGIEISLSDFAQGLVKLEEPPAAD